MNISFVSVTANRHHLHLREHRAGAELNSRNASSFNEKRAITGSQKWIEKKRLPFLTNANVLSLFSYFY
jgi:hypothetical protein